MKCQFCDSEQPSPCETMGDMFLCPNTTWESAPDKDVKSDSRDNGQGTSGSEK